MLEIALKCIARGWYVFPCRVKGKEPIIKGGFKQATNDEVQIRAWWAKWPEANVGIATGASGLTVLDIDGGMTNALGVELFREARGLPKTYTVRTGRRPGFGVQMYFQTDAPLKSIAWVDPVEEAINGDVRGGTGYVLAQGCAHPSGAFYEALVEAPIAMVPEYVKTLKAVSYGGITGGKNAGVVDDGGPITQARNNALTSILGRYRAEGHTDEEVEAFAHEVNESRCQPPLGEAELDRLIENACRWEMGRPELAVSIGGKVETTAVPAEPVDWRSLFHTRAETENTPDPEFLVRDFLQAESVTGIIGPARARKSIVSLNIIHALLTGEPLFGRFEVSCKPERVIYLCPESGKSSLAKRIRNLGLSKYVGETLFYTSMNSDPMALTDPLLREAAKGSVVFIDTAIRFFEGDENDAGDMKIMGAQCQALIREGARAIVLLHHTAKNAEKITLESGRGSGDFGGFLTCCWGTTLDDYDDAYRAQSLMTCVKQRDFQADKFKLSASGDPDDFVLRYVENDGVVVSAKAEGNKRKTQGADKVAKDAYEADPDISVNALRLALQAEKFGKGTEWCRKKLAELKGTGVTLV